MKYARLSVVSVVLVAGACADDVGTELVTHAATPEVVAVCAESANALCARAEACSQWLTQGAYGSHALCVRDVAADCEATYSGPGSSSAPASCAATANALSCAELQIHGPAPYLFASCAVTPGRFAAGESCLEHGDCESGFCYRVGDCTKTPCVYPCGSCQGAPSQEGGSCSPANRCAAGLVCVTAPEVPNPTPASPRTCVRPSQLGEACSANRPCAGGVFLSTTCSPRSDAPSENVCVEVGTGGVGGLGDSCAGGKPCSRALGLGCSPARLCAPIPLVPIGASCEAEALVGLPRPSCDATARCEKNVCVAFGQLGDPCVASANTRSCAGPLQCDDATSRCVVRQTRAASCTSP